MSAQVPRYFLGQAKAPSPRRARAAVLGPPGVFFDRLLRASEQVEQYDEELDCETVRFGLSTSRIAPARVGASFRRHTGRGAFVVLAGYLWPPEALLRQKDYGVVIFSQHFSDGAVERRDKAGRHLPTLTLGYRRGGSAGQRGDAALSAREIATWMCTPKLPKPPRNPLLVVIDPLVMDPSLFPVPGNVEPGGLLWYHLTGLLRSIFSGGRVDGALLLPCRLPARDQVPSFVLARLTAKLLAYGLAPHRQSRA